MPAGVQMLNAKKTTNLKTCLRYQRSTHTQAYRDSHSDVRTWYTPSPPLDRLSPPIIIEPTPDYSLILVAVKRREENVALYKKKRLLWFRQTALYREGMWSPKVRPVRSRAEAQITELVSLTPLICEHFSYWDLLWAILGARVFLLYFFISLPSFSTFGAFLRPVYYFRHL